MEQLDYRKLLVKYIEHIGNMEGIDYINRYEWDLKKLGLTDQEIEELKVLSKESYDGICG